MGALVWCNFFSKPLEPETFFLYWYLFQYAQRDIFILSAQDIFSQCISLQDIFFPRKQSAGYLFLKKNPTPSL